MLKEIHKFASETSRPIAICGTLKHTHGQINGVMQPRMSTKCGIHGKRSCCTTQERRQHDCSIGGYDTCAQPIRCKMDNFLSQVCYVCMVPGVSLKHDIIGCRVWYGSYLQWGMMLWHLLTSSLLSFCLKAFSLFFLWPHLHNAQSKIAIVYMREQT